GVAIDVRAVVEGPKNLPDVRIGRRAAGASRFGVPARSTVVISLGSVGRRRGTKSDHRQGGVFIVDQTSAVQAMSNGVVRSGRRVARLGAAIEKAYRLVQLDEGEIVDCSLFAVVAVGGVAVPQHDGAADAVGMPNRAGGSVGIEAEVDLHVVVDRIRRGGRA